MVMMTRLVSGKPTEVDAARYGDLAVCKGDSVPWVVFHAPTGKEVMMALPPKLRKRGTQRRQIKEWCLAFQADARAKPIWQSLKRGDIADLEPSVSRLMIEVGQSV